MCFWLHDMLWLWVDWGWSVCVSIIGTTQYSSYCCSTVHTQTLYRGKLPVKFSSYTYTCIFLPSVNAVWYSARASGYLKTRVPVPGTPDHTWGPPPTGGTGGLSAGCLCFAFCNFVFVNFFCTYLCDQLSWAYLLFLVARHCASTVFQFMLCFAHLANNITWPGVLQCWCSCLFLVVADVMRALCV